MARAAPAGWAEVMADREALDLMTGDMAGHQAATGRLPTPAENQALAAQVFERLDHKAAEAKPRVTPDPPAREVDAADSGGSAAAAKAQQMGYRMLRERDLPELVPVKMGPQTLERYEKIRARVKLLLTKVESGPLGAPSWADRMWAALSLKMTGRTEREVIAVGRLFGIELAIIHQHQGGKVSSAKAVLRLVEESSAVFGPWYADAPAKVMVG